MIFRGWRLGAREQVDEALAAYALQLRAVTRLNLTTPDLLCRCYICDGTVPAIRTRIGGWYCISTVIGQILLSLNNGVISKGALLCKQDRHRDPKRENPAGEESGKSFR